MSVSLCEDMGVSRCRAAFVNEVRGDDEVAATQKGLTLSAAGTIVIRPGASPNNVDVDGDAVVRGKLTLGPSVATAGSVSSADFAGSYWHLEGGQLLLTRTIAATDRVAPGTDVPLSGLASGADTYRWEFTNSAASTVGAPPITIPVSTPNAQPPAPFVEGGVLKVPGGSTASFAKDVGNAGTFVAKVALRVDMSETDPDAPWPILTYRGMGVYVANGFFALNDGASFIASAVPVSSDSFSLALVFSGTTASAYVNGERIAQSSAAVTTGSNNNVALSGGPPVYPVVDANNVAYHEGVWYDDLRVIEGQAVANKNTLLYGWREMYAEPVTVTYGFRVANDESLQLVKVRGSAGASRALDGPAPRTVTGGNDMGGLFDGAIDVVTRSSN